MAYIFETQDVATLRFDSGNPATTLSISNISGTVSSAQTIINGVNALLYIGDLQENYDPEDAIRTVKQNVIDE